MFLSLHSAVYTYICAFPLYTYTLYTYVHSGPGIEPVGKQSVQSSHVPLMMYDGTVGCRLKNGAIDNIPLDTHRALATSHDTLAKAAPARRCVCYVCASCVTLDLTLALT